MDTITIEILNPKARKLLKHLAELKLIAISKGSPNQFLKVVEKFRSKKARISPQEIALEVEAVRSKRYARRKA
jgi:hypothetical protein